MSFKPIIGLEIHLELNTNTKAFSGTIINKNSIANEAITAYDLAHPGLKPRVNEKMVRFGYYLAKTLKMNIADEIIFDRKNYFYPDLAKGFQITQFNKPIGTEGIFPLMLEDGSFKEIAIKEIHLEEDTAKQISINGETRFDFNRAGIPLIEIVTSHENFTSEKEVTLFIQQFQELVRLLDISDAKLEDGSMRVDVNISVREESDTDFRKRSEIKNINSIANIESAIKFETDLQIQKYLTNEEVFEETKRWDEETSTTIKMRNKGNSDHYNYIAETNILPFFLTDEMKESLLKNLEEKMISFEEREFLFKNNLSIDKIKIVLNSFPTNIIIFRAFIEKNPEKINHYFSFIFERLQGILKELNMEIFETKMTWKHLQDLFFLLENKVLNNSTLKNTIVDFIKKDIDQDEITEAICKLKNQKQLTKEEITILVDEIIDEQEKNIEKFKDNEKKLNGLLMGQLMKKTQGKANAAISSSIIKEKIIKIMKL